MLAGYFLKNERGTWDFKEFAKVTIPNFGEDNKGPGVEPRFRVTVEGNDYHKRDLVYKIKLMFCRAFYMIGNDRITSNWWEEYGEPHKEYLFNFAAATLQGPEQYDYYLGQITKAVQEWACGLELWTEEERWRSILDPKFYQDNRYHLKLEKPQYELPTSELYLDWKYWARWMRQNGKHIKEFRAICERYPMPDRRVK